MKEIFDTREYVQLMSSISFEEVMTIEFRRGKNIQWESMVYCEDGNRKKYLCSVCNVCQYGEKNLLSHLSGKKHIIKMDTVSQMFLPNAPGRKPNKNSQQATGGKKMLPANNATKPEDGKNKTVCVTQSKKAQTKTTVAVAKTIASCSPKLGIKPTTSTNLAAKGPLVAKVHTNANTKAVEKVAAKTATTANTRTNMPKAAGATTSKISGKVNKAKPATVDSLKAATTSVPGNKPANQLNKRKPAKPSVPKTITSKSASVSKPQSTAEPNKAIPISLITTKLEVANESCIRNSNVNAITNRAKVAPTVLKPENISSSMASNANKGVSAKPGLTKPKVEASPNKISNFPKKTGISCPKPSTTVTSVKPVTFNVKKVVSPPDQATESNVTTVGTINTSKSSTISDVNRKTVKEPLLASADNTLPNREADEPRDSSLIRMSIAEKVDEQNDDYVVIDSSDEHSKNVEESIKKKSIVSTHQNLVLNPFSAVAVERKISCVPLSKLISSMPIEANIKTEERVKVSDGKAIETISKRAETSRHRDEKNDKHRSIETINTRSAIGLESTASFSSSPHPLIGVEYVIKIVRSLRDIVAKYHCSLCNIATDETSMLSHLVGYNHRLKYCERHFQTALRLFNQYIAHVPEHMVFNVLSPMLEKLAMAVQKHHGQDSVYICYEHLYMKNKTDVILTVYNRRHASEMSGPSFTHVVDTAEVAALIERATGGSYQTNDIAANTNFAFQNSDASDSYSSYLSNKNGSNCMKIVDDETHKRMVDNFLRDTQKTKALRNRNLRGDKRTHSRSKSPEHKRRHSSSTVQSQWNLERRSISPLRDEDIWQAYRHMVDQSVRDLNKTFELYNTDAEQHPLYNEEWQKFWKRRKDELIAAGINYRTYNFQNEWIHFFNARLDELFNQDVENIKIRCRERLCLPMTNDEMINTKYHVHISEDETNQVDSSEKPQAEGTVVDTEGEVNVIHVLRLLTALEDFLGSLGPKVTQLLGTALQMSKLHPDNANNQFLTSENCAILETAKEKFTGLVISKILDNAQERAVKRAITDTESLLKYAAKIGAQSVDIDVDLDAVRQKSLQQKITNKPDIPKKSDLVAKLASTLISQGKTSINQDQLQQIVQVYSYMEQRKNQDTPSTCRSNLPNRTSPGVELGPHRDRSESINELASYTTASNNQYTYHSAMTNNIPNSITNPLMIRDMSNMNSSANYTSVDMARANNSNTINNNGRASYCNRQNRSQYNQYDRGMFIGGNSRIQPNIDEYNKTINSQPNYIDGNYNFGSNNNNARGQRMDWN